MTVELICPLRGVFMGFYIRSVFLSVAVLLPNASIAQVYLLPTPPPAVSAASADWQISGNNIFHAGNFYYPAGPTVFFDGKVMSRVGEYFGVPLYEDGTLEPYSKVFVPIGRNLMRPYERLREGELAGTVGSRTPSFPIQHYVELSAASRAAYRFQTAFVTGGSSAGLPERQGTSAMTAATMCCFPMQDRAAAAVPAAYAPTAMQSIPGPTAGTAGVWIEFEGARYYSDGAALSYDPDRFVPLGNYRGFPVYRDTRSGTDRIFVTVVPDGPVAPFARR
jgi:hypothetical protein